MVRTPKNQRVLEIFHIHETVSNCRTLEAWTICFLFAHLEILVRESAVVDPIDQQFGEHWDVDSGVRFSGKEERSIRVLILETETCLSVQKSVLLIEEVGESIVVLPGRLPIVCVAKAVICGVVAESDSDGRLQKENIRFLEVDEEYSLDQSKLLTKFHEYGFS